MIKKCAIFILLTLATCVSAYADVSPFQENILIPAGLKKWALLDSLLPSGQDTVYLVPRQQNTKKLEFLSITEMPEGMRLNQLTMKIPPNVKDVFANERMRNSNLIAFDNPEDETFHVLRVFRGNKRIYELHYATPLEGLKEQHRRDCVRICRETHIGTEPRQGSWIAFKPGEGIFQNGKLLEHASNEMQTHADQDLAYTIECPATWMCGKAEWTQSQTHPSSPFTTASMLTRMDHLAFGNVSHAKLPEGQKSWEQHDSQWQESMNHVRETGANTLIKEGDITNQEGLRGKFAIVQEPEGSQFFRAYYWDNDNIYKIELWTNQENYSKLAPTFHHIATHFKLKN